MTWIETPRLRLERFTRDSLDALFARDQERLEALWGAAVPHDFPGADFADRMRWLLDQAVEHPDRAPWDGAILLRHPPTAIGTMGFVEPPGPMGRVEMGYSILPAFRRQGYATEMARALTGWVVRQPGVRIVTARCEPDNHPSIRILEAVGFQRTGVAHGLVTWEYPI